eukprot:tig00000737_g3799.t1
MPTHVHAYGACSNIHAAACWHLHLLLALHLLFGSLHPAPARAAHVHAPGDLGASGSRSGVGRGRLLADPPNPPAAAAGPLLGPPASLQLGLPVEIGPSVSGPASEREWRRADAPHSDVDAQPAAATGQRSVRVAEQKIVELFRWLEENGAYVHSALAAGERNGTRGLFATSEIPAGEVLFRVPRRLILGCDERKAEHARIAKVLRLGPEDARSPVETSVCAAALILKESVDPQSFWGPYLRVLPRDYELPVLDWTEDELELFGHDAGKRIEQAAALRAIVDHMREVLPVIAPEATEADLQWAVRSAVTRTWDVCGFTPLDMFNHNSKLGAFVTFDEAGAGSAAKRSRRFARRCTRAEISTAVPYPSGSEVFVSYGLVSGADLLMNYGFLPPLEEDAVDFDFVSRPAAGADFEGAAVWREALLAALDERGFVTSGLIEGDGTIRVRQQLRLGDSPVHPDLEELLELYRSLAVAAHALGWSPSLEALEAERQARGEERPPHAPGRADVEKDALFLVAADVRRKMDREAEWERLRAPSASAPPAAGVDRGRAAQAERLRAQRRAILLSVLRNVEALLSSPQCLARGGAACTRPQRRP